MLIIVDGHLTESDHTVLDKRRTLQRIYDCFGLVGDNNKLFWAKMFLVPLEKILNTLRG